MLRLRCAVLVLMLALVACGGDGGGDAKAVAKDPKALLASAAQRTAQDDTVRMVMKATLSGGTSVVSGSGAFDFAKQLGRFALKTSIGPSFDLVFTADKVYVKSTSAAAGADQQWTALTDDDLKNPATGVGFLSALREQVDPRAALRNLGTSVQSVKLVGSGKIRGVDTTHLRGQVDLSDEAIAKAPVELQDGLREAQKTIGAAGYPIDVWLDDQGRVRRVEYAMSFGAAMGGAGATTVRMDLFDFGKDAEITVPPADQVRTPQPAAG